MPQNAVVHTRNPHDGWLEIATGQDVSAGEVIGSVCWQVIPREYGSDEGYWLRIDTGSTDEFMLADVGEVVTTLAEHGHTLDPVSWLEIADLRLEG